MKAACPGDRYQGAKRHFRNARDPAWGQSFNHQFIGTEHLLPGLLREQEGIAALALAKLGVALDPVRAAVEKKFGRGNQLVEEDIDYVPRARKVLSLALAEAERQGSAYVRTKHILLGMVRDGSGVGADILDTLGVWKRYAPSFSSFSASSSPTKKGENGMTETSDVWTGAFPTDVVA